MKTNIIFVAIVILFMSCSKHEHLEPEVARWDRSYWGYFNGTVNSNQYDHVNSESNDIINGNSRCIIDDRTTKFVSIQIDENTIVRIAVANMEPGRSEVKFGRWDAIRSRDSAADIKVVGDDNSIKYYIPSEKNPLELSVLDVVWSPVKNPYFDATIKGIFYKKDNSTAFITVDLNFGV